MSISGKAIVEIQELHRRASELAHGDAKSRAESNVLLSKIKTIQRIGISTDEVNAKYFDEKTGRSRESLERAEKRYAALFEQYITGALPKQEFESRCAKEFRSDDQTSGLFGRPISETYAGGDLQGGTTSGIAGGYTVPFSMFERTINSTKQFAELMDADNVSLIVEPSYAMPAKVLVGWDFSTYQSTLVGDVTQAFSVGGASSAPQAYEQIIKSYIHFVELRLANELVQDAENGVVGGIIGSLADGFGEAFGRGLANYLVNGNGTGQPKGILNAAPASGVSGSVSLATLENIYFGMNRAYRNSPKCAWLLNDSVYKAIRQLTDDQHRPLIHIVKDDELLFGKKILIAPEAPSSPLVTGKIAFGDFSKFVVRVSQMTVQRLTERWVDFGETGIIARLRVDCAYFDPSNGTTPPITVSTVTP